MAVGAIGGPIGSGIGNVSGADLPFDWWADLSPPPQTDKDVQAYKVAVDASGTFIDPYVFTLPELVSIDRWQQPLEEPPRTDETRARFHNLLASSTFGIIPPPGEEEDTFDWIGSFRPLNEPPRTDETRARFSNLLANKTFGIIPDFEETYQSQAWEGSYRPLNEPPRTSEPKDAYQNLLSQLSMIDIEHGAFTEPSTAEDIDWFVELDKPRLWAYRPALDIANYPSLFLVKARPFGESIQNFTVLQAIHEEYIDLTGYHDEVVEFTVVHEETHDLKASILTDKGIETDEG